MESTYRVDVGQAEGQTTLGAARVIEHTSMDEWDGFSTGK